MISSAVILVFSVSYCLTFSSRITLELFGDQRKDLLPNTLLDLAPWNPKRIAALGWSFERLLALGLGVMAVVWDFRRLAVRRDTNQG